MSKGIIYNQLIHTSKPKSMVHDLVCLANDVISGAGISLVAIKYMGKDYSQLGISPEQSFANAVVVLGIAQFLQVRSPEVGPRSFNICAGHFIATGLMLKFPEALAKIEAAPALLITIGIASILSLVGKEVQAKS